MQAMDTLIAGTIGLDVFGASTLVALAILLGIGGFRALFGEVADLFA